jgi:hypothetical protein
MGFTGIEDVNCPAKYPGDQGGSGLIEMQGMLQYNDQVANDKNSNDQGGHQ